EIQAKAAELNHNPTKIYNWVRNNIEYVPTYGSIQGANMCLQTKLCNDFDTASLLIALLRASEIHARYVYGTIELPIEKVKNWIGGFTDANAALTLIASGRIPLKGLTSGGKIVSVQMEHVWVEAYIPYGNYRGTMIDQSIKSWISMDGSYKQYEYTAGMDIAKNIPFNKSSYLSKFNDIPPVEFYFQQIQSYLDTNFPGKTIEDLKRTKKIIEENLELLSPTLPYKTIVKLATLSGLTDSYHYKVGIIIPDIFGVGLTYQVSISEIMGKRVTISYVPSTSADEQLIKQYGGFYNVPAYLLRVKPAVKIEGNIVALGDEIAVGTEQELNVTLVYPANKKADMVTHNIKAGGYYALGLVSKGIKEDLIEQRFEKYKETVIVDYPDPYNDPFLGEILNMTILRYFYNIDESKSQFAEVVHYSYSKDISEGIAGKNIDVSYIYGVPYKIVPSTYWVDIQREVSLLLPIDGDNGKRIEIINLLGLTSSVLENQTLERMMSIESISAVKAIQIANDRGIPIHYIDQGNLTQELAVMSVSEDVKTFIRNTVNQGKIVTVPETNLQYNLWYGVGWIVEDPATGAGAYLISGYLMGGESTKPNPGTDPDPNCTFLDVYLGDDIYRAIAYVESRWSQFRQDGTPETSGSAYGIMQIERRTWKGAKWPGRDTLIDWDNVLNDWTYNVALGQAIYEWNLNNVVPKDLEDAGITNPTEEQKMLDALSRYNIFKPYYKPKSNGERDSHVGCDYADTVMKVYKEKTWTNIKKLRCRK
ncbi:MAG: transglutaminase domain-containing protein, partial [Thermodesulfovibrionales bacterium]